LGCLDGHADGANAEIEVREGHEYVHNWGVGEIVPNPGDDFVSGCGEELGRVHRGAVQIELDVRIVPGHGEAEAGEVVLVIDQRIGPDEGGVFDWNAAVGR